MRHSIATFYVLPLAETPAVEAAADAAALRRWRWFGGERVEDVLRARAVAASEFGREGLIALWSLMYLWERRVRAWSDSFFMNMPLAETISAGMQAQDRRKVQFVVTFDNAYAAEGLRVLSANGPSKSDVFEFYRARSVSALGDEEGDRHFREDASVPELVENCHAAYYWLADGFGQVTPGTLGVLTCRATRPPRRQWLPRRKESFLPTPRIFTR